MNYFKSFPIAENLLQIEDLCGTKFYLVEGSTQAALLDSGIGLGHVASYVRTLTDKPLIVLLTHGHLDHAMGSGTFYTETPVFLNALDRDVYVRHSELSLRKDYYHTARWRNPFQAIRNRESTLSWATPAEAESLRPLSVGDCFSIGGETLEILPGAGHTPGCVTILLQQHRILLLGDTLNSYTFLFDENALPVSTLKGTLEDLRNEAQNRFDRVLFCHGAPNKPGYGVPEIISDGIELCGAILAGKDAHIPTVMMEQQCFRARKRTDQTHLCNILYSERICH